MPRRRRPRVQKPNAELLQEYRTFEVNATQRCNAVCEHCDRLVGTIKLPNSDVTESQMRLAVDAMHEVGYKPVRVAIAGGEPMLNSEIQGIINQLARLGRNIAVLTNNVRNWKLPNMPNRRRRIWFRDSPLEKKEHVPFLVSPHDAGMYDDRACSIQQKCGIAFSAWGFSMCPVADTLGHLLRRNPYSDKPIVTRDMEICKHCPHSVRRGPRLELYKLSVNGRISTPSPTLQEGLERYLADPIHYPRFGEPHTEYPKTPPKQLVQIKMPTGYRGGGKSYPSALPDEVLQ